MEHDTKLKERKFVLKKKTYYYFPIFPIDQQGTFPNHICMKSHSDQKVPLVIKCLLPVQMLDRK